MSNLRPHVVSKLEPERTGPRDGLYQLTESSAHPTRVVGRDRFGAPIEETIAMNAPRQFVTMSGCINSVPMRCNPSTWATPEGEKYGDEQLKRLLQSGWIPLDTCPHTREYRSWTGTTALVETGPGDEDCGGAPDGCSCLRAVIALRRERAAVQYAEFERANAQLTPGEAAAMVRRFGLAVDTVAELAEEPEAQHTTAPARRKAPRPPGRPEETE